jgi:hypothetical protein
MRPVQDFAGGGAIALAFVGLCVTGDRLGHELRASTETAPVVRTAAIRTIDLAPRCVEDDACWTWSTMGNHRRGVLVSGARRVVGPCTYRKLVLAGLVDRKAEPLRGDSWAIQHGCGDASQLSIHPTGVVEG